MTIEGDPSGYRAGLVSPPPRRWILGDSFAFGWGVEARDAFGALLAAAGEPCIALALPGDGLAEHRARLERALASGEQPLGVVVALYDNDLLPADLGAALREPRRLAVRRTLLRSHVARLVARALERVGLADAAADATGARAAREARLAVDLALHERGAEHGPALAALRDLLRRARATGAPVVLLRIVPLHAAGGPATRAALAALGREPAAHDFARLDAELAALAAEVGVAYLRFAPRTPAEERAFYFEHDQHLTPAGHAALAELLLRHLRG